MKKLITVLCLLIGTCYGQIPLINGVPEYVFEDTTIRFGQSDLFKKAKIAMVETFKDAKEVVQYENSEQGDIIGKGILYFYNAVPFNDHVRNTAKFSIVINCRKGKYRIKLYDITTYTGTGEYELSVLGHPLKQTKRMHAAYLEYVQSFDDSMRGALRAIANKINEENATDYQ